MTSGDNRHNVSTFGSPKADRDELIVRITNENIAVEQQIPVWYLALSLQAGAEKQLSYKHLTLPSGMMHWGIIRADSVLVGGESSKWQIPRAVRQERIALVL